MDIHSELAALRGKLHLAQRRLEERDELVTNLQESLLRLTEEYNDLKEKNTALSSVNRQVSDRLESTNLTLQAVLKEKEALEKGHAPARANGTSESTREGKEESDDLLEGYQTQVEQQQREIEQLTQELSKARGTIRHYEREVSDQARNHARIVETLQRQIADTSKQLLSAPTYGQPPPLTVAAIPLPYEYPKPPHQRGATTKKPYMRNPRGVQPLPVNLTDPYEEVTPVANTSNGTEKA